MGFILKWILNCHLTDCQLLLFSIIFSLPIDFFLFLFDFLGYLKINMNKSHFLSTFRDLVSLLMKTILTQQDHLYNPFNILKIVFT